MLRIGVVMYQTSLTKGQELVAQRMVKEFRRLGHDAFLITSVYQDSEQVADPEEVRRKGGYIHLFDRYLGIPVIRVNSEGTTWPPRRISFVDFIGVLSSIVDDLKLNVLITHSTLWNGPEEVLKFVAWRRKMMEGGTPRSPLVFCHMSHFQEPNDERYAIAERSFRETWNSIILPRVLAEANLVLVTTPLEAEFMKALGARDEKIFLFPGGIDDEEIASLGDEDAFRGKYGLPADAKLVSFLGSVEERKNALQLLDVAKLLSNRTDIRFIIAGRAEGPYGESVIEGARTLANVSVLGQISEGEKAALIRTSFTNLTMTRAEALGISQLEFMSAGVPVITSGVGGQSWIVSDGSNGIVLNGPDDSKGAAAAITRLADNPRLRGKLGKAAKLTASACSLTILVDRLSKRLQREVENSSDEMLSLKSIPAGEQVIEAWVHEGQRVAATSKRLIVRSVQSGQEVTSVPYDDIARIVKHSEAPWAVLGIGAAATTFLLAQRIAGLGLLTFITPGVSAALSFFGLSGATGIVMTLLPFFPVAIASAAFLLAMRRGYLVHYGSSRSLFLPLKFVKAVKLADKLTPNDLFAVESEPSVKRD